jgi:hypothetical protein
MQGSYDMEQTVNKVGNGDSKGRKERKQRLTVSLSPQSMKAFAELREFTDADTDSEVVRNALRLHLALLRAQSGGKELLVRDGKNDQLVPVRLFAPE